MKLMKLKLLVIALITFAASSAFASFTYSVSVDTSTLATQAGYLYLAFNPGDPTAQAASASIGNFATDGTLGTQDTADVFNGSAVTGTLPGTVTFGNTNYANDYNHAITFGNSFSFNLTLDGPAVTAPNGTANTGTAFSLALFNDALGTTPFLTADGTLFTVSLDTNGIATVNSIATQADVTPTPIPAAAWLFGSGLLGLAGIRRRMAA